MKTLGLTSPRTEKCGQMWYTNFFITLKTIKGMECASLMPIDLFFEAPRLMDSCNFTDDHTSLTRDDEICDSVSVVKPNKVLRSHFTTLSCTSVK